MNKKNVIIILIDGGRLDYALNSEKFSKLKSESIFLSQSITYGPHTIASMHAVFSGTYGIKTGTNSYWSTFKFKKNKYKTLTEYLHDNDYYTEADVINQLVIPKQGFDEFNVHDEDNDNLTERHKKIIQSINDKSNQRKFFLYLHYSGIHTGIKKEVLNVYHNHSKEFFNNIDQNKNRYKDLFLDAEKYLDSILDEIKKQKIDNESLILIMSDHGVSQGEKFGEHAYGAFCYDYTLRTFAYFLVKDLPSIEIKQQTRTIDFMPTILDYLDLEHDKNYNKIGGRSLIPLFNGSSMEEEIAFSETGNPLYEKKPPKEPNTRSVRTSKWKYIKNIYDESEELYDIINDPNEEKNIIDIDSKVSNELRYKMNEILNS